MNTRLQVEHPVTELVTGRDLVADQLRIAAGEPLGVTQAELDAARAAGGHAVEVRLYAEDAEAGFLPATGRVERLRWPTRRRASAWTPGSTRATRSTGRFDPMLAKVIAHGRDRAEALDRLAAALDDDRRPRPDHEPPLPALARARAGRPRRAGADRHPRPDLAARRLGGADRRSPSAAWSAAARALGADGWRLNGPARVRLAADDGSERVVELGVTAADATRGGPERPVDDRRSPSSTAPLTWTSGAGASRSASRRRPTSIGQPGPRSPTTPAVRRRSPPRCPGASSPSMSSPARSSRPAIRS